MRASILSCLTASLLVGCSAGPSGNGNNEAEGEGDSEPRDCGVESGDEFALTVHGGSVFPYKPDSEAPWDWDGDVPDWMIDVTEALGTILASPELKTTAEILEIVDEYGPVLLDGTVPPDPVLAVFAALKDPATTTTSTVFGGTTTTTTYGTYVFETRDTRDDTYEPEFDEAVEVDLFPDEELWLYVYDEDLVDDDYVGAAILDLRDLRDLSGCGRTRLRGGPGNGLYSVEIEVDAR